MEQDKLKEWNSDECYLFYPEIQHLTSEPLRTFIDVGANEGKIIKQVKSVYPQVKTYAFEPVEEYQNKLSNIANVEVFNFGLWDKDGEGRFYLKKDMTTSSFIKPIQEEVKSEIKVEQRRFDSLSIEIKRPCFVKIDVERGEKEVIEGFGKRLLEVDILQFEYHLKDSYNKVDLGRIISLLYENGFNGFIQKIFAWDGKIPKTCDLIFYKV